MYSYLFYSTKTQPSDLIAQHFDSYESYSQQECQLPLYSIYIYRERASDDL